MARLFDKSGALDLSVVEQVWLCFHETQRTVAYIRKQRVAYLRRMGESSMGLSRRKAVDQGEIYNKGDHRTMSRDRKVEDVAAVNRAERTATKLRTIYGDELQQVEPYRKQKMLHAHTFKITNCMPEHGPTKEGNNPGILQNTILVDSFRTRAVVRTQTGRLPMQVRLIAERERDRERQRQRQTEKQTDIERRPRRPSSVPHARPLAWVDRKHLQNEVRARPASSDE